MTSVAHERLPGPRGGIPMSATQAIRNEMLLEELIEQIDAAVGSYVDPGKCIALGVRMLLRSARANAGLVRFLCEGGMRITPATGRLVQRLTRHIASGRRSARFAEMPVEVALDVIGASILAAVERMALGLPSEDYFDQVVAAVLRALGVPPGEASRLVKIPLPALPRAGHPA